MGECVGEESPWLNGKIISRTPNLVDDANDRLTSLSDDELQRIVLVEDCPKIGGLLPIDGLRGERERLQSRTSSKASRKPKIRSSSHLSERDEEKEAHVEGNVTPWSNNQISPHRRDEEIAIVTETYTESQASLPKPKGLHKGKQSEVGSLQTDAHLGNNEKAKFMRDLEMNKRNIYEAYKHTMAAESIKKSKDLPKEMKTVQTEPLSSDLGKEIEGDGYVSKGECTKHQSKKGFEEEDVIPKMKSRTAVQSRDTLENSRMTHQSLQSVSLAMGMDADDDNDSLEFGCRSHDLNGDGYETQVHQTDDHGHVSIGQDHEVECQNTRDLMLIPQKHKLTGKKQVHRSGVAKPKGKS